MSMNLTARSHTITLAFASFMTMMLGGCRVGPKYVTPTAPAPAPAYKESAPAAYNNAPAGAWQPAKPEDAMLKGKWWEVFNEPELNGLEEQLNINNQNIATYFQNFMAARAQVREAHAGYYPTLSTDPSYTRQRSPGTSSVPGSNGTTSTRFATPCFSIRTPRRSQPPTSKTSG
jgi:outer membrane protein TolC